MCLCVRGARACLNSIPSSLALFEDFSSSMCVAAAATAAACNIIMAAEQGVQYFLPFQPPSRNEPVLFSSPLFWADAYYFSTLAHIDDEE